MNSDLLNYIFQNTKNIINDTKSIFDNIIITDNEKKNIYLFMHTRLNNIYENIIKKKVLFKKYGLILDDNFFILFHNIIDELNYNLNNIKKGGLQIITKNKNNITDYISIIDKASKKILKFTDNKIDYVINKKISIFFKILENIYKIDNKEFIEKINIFFTNNIVINKDNYFINYFKRLIKRYTNNNINNNIFYNDLINIQNNQQNFFNKIFLNYLNTYKILKKTDNYDIDILKLFKKLNNFLLFLDNNNLNNNKIGIYLKIINELFLSNFFRNNKYSSENKVIYYIIIILGILVIEDFFNNFKKNKITKNIILILFILLTFLLTLILIIIK